MPALPWSARGALPPTYACFVTASQQALRRYRNIPAFMRHLKRLRRELRGAEGILGYAFAARLRDRTFWTVSAWVDPEAAALFAKAHADTFAVAIPPRTASTDVSWSCLAEELPVRWDEAQARLTAAAHPGAGAVPAR